MAIRVAKLWTKFRDPYRPGAGPVVQPWIAPDRRTLITFRQRWPLVSMGVICAAIVVATLPLQKDLTGFMAALAIAGIYALLTVMFSIWEQRHATESLQFRQNVRGLRKVLMLAGLTGTLWFLPAASSELWLLYLIPMVTVGIDLERRWAFAFVAATMLLMFWSALLQPPEGAAEALSFTVLRDGLMRTMVGGYLGLTSYLLARCLAYQHKASSEAVNRLVEVPSTQRWMNTMDMVAGLVAELFSEPDRVVTANVLIYDAVKGRMRLAGSSRPDGQELVTKEFTFPATQGITSWAAVHNLPCFLNDTEHDPQHRFLADPAFPNTRSALAVPFPLDGGQRAVLEIESEVPGNIAYEDLQLMELIAGYLVGAYKTSEWLEFHRRTVALGQELADRIIHVEQIGAMLAEIGEVALDLVDADVIGFYYCDPDTGRIEERGTVGQLLVPEATGSPINAPDSLVLQLLQQGQVRFFPDTTQEEPLMRRNEWHLKQQIEPFVVREQIASCAAIPLVLGQERLGLMWVNYRQAQDFPKPLQYSLQMLAPFAALAIKSGVQSAYAERQRRERLRRDLHDSLSAQLENAARAMDRLSFCDPGTERWKETFQTAMVSVKWATTVVAALLRKREWMTLPSIVADLQAQADVSSRIYEIPVLLRAAEMPPIQIGHEGGNELLFACNEAVNNALRHAHATCIEIAVTVEDEALRICICDDGVGFDPTQLKRVYGIHNMRVRIEESLAGSLTLTSAPGAGTTIVITVPLHNTVEGKEN